MNSKTVRQHIKSIDINRLLRWSVVALTLLLIGTIITISALVLEQSDSTATLNQISEKVISPTIHHSCDEVHQSARMHDTDLIGQGEMIVWGGKKILLPLIHTDVQGKIDGAIANVTVQQTFINTKEHPIEAIYTFPLPENSAVDSMQMTIGNRIISAVIKERGEARAIYNQARRSGRTATLLEQQRPNIFTQSVANILPGDTIIVTLRYQQELDYVLGEYRFNFPMTVGPRYIPGNAIAPAISGTENPTNQVPDADKITPPIVKAGTRSGHTISLSLDINGGKSISKFNSESHTINSTTINPQKTKIHIAPCDKIPNKDFIFTFQLAEKKIAHSLITYKDSTAGYFQLLVLPQLSPKESEIVPRELIFVIDNSGSMNGFPMDKCRDLMQKALTNLRPQDTYNIMTFAGSVSTLYNTSQAATPANIDQGLAFSKRMRGSGGTEMLKAFKRLMTLPQIAHQKRMVLFMTDGYIGNEKAILSTVRDNLGDTRVFSLAVGTSPNNYLLRSMAQVGGGAFRMIRPDGDSEKAVKEYYRLIDAPVLTNLKVTVQGVTTDEILPEPIPDLFSGAPLMLSGTYRKGGDATVTITGDLPAGKKYTTSFKAHFPKDTHGNSALRSLWARKKVDQLELYGSGLFGDISYTPDDIKEKITKLGLTYNLMTHYTSFVAVDSLIRTASTLPEKVEQAVEMPEGVSYESQEGHRYLGKTGGGGNPASIVTKKGTLGTLSGAISQSSNQDIFGSGGYARSVDAILAGSSGLTAGSSSARQSSSTISRGGGVGSGFGGGSSSQKIQIKSKAPSGNSEAVLNGGRSRGNIMRVVRQNLSALRYAFNKRLAKKPGISGTIKVKIAIDEYGNVLFVKVVSNDMSDQEFEKTLIKKIKLWKFGSIDKPGDVTEIVYPFVFKN